MRTSEFLALQNVKLSLIVGVVIDLVIGLLESTQYGKKSYRMPVAEAVWKKVS